MSMHSRFCLFSLAVVAATGPVSAQEESHPTQSSKEFAESFDSELNTLVQGNFHENLASPSLGAATGADYANAVKAIKATWNTLTTQRGQSTETYDVVLQPGHYKRLKGKVGTSGKDVSEQELAAHIVKVAADELKKTGKLKVLVISADEFSPNLKSKVFLAVHADGSAPACKTGPSLSYQKNSSTLAMHAIGFGLSQALGYKYEDFRKDGFTADAAKYYMFSQVDAPVMKGLLEVGELTCRPMEQRLIQAADGIGSNVARAITFVLDAAQVAPNKK